jgi:hypothetical protein
VVLFALDAHFDQPGHHVIGGMPPLVLSELVEVLVQGRVGGDALRRRVVLTRLTVQDQVEPVPKLLPLGDRDTQHPGDHLNRERRGELVHEVEPVPARELVEMADDDLPDHWFQPGHRTGREDAVDQLALPGMLRLVHPDDARPVDELGVQQIPQPHAVSVAEHHRVTMRPQHILVPGQGIEPVPLAVIHRRPVTKFAVGRVRVVEELL